MARAALIVAAVLGAGAPAQAQRLDGFNVIAVPQHPYGSASARELLEQYWDM